MIRLENIAHRYVSGSGARAKPTNSQTIVEALGPLSLEVRPGEFLSVLGPSGCGKTTLLHIMAGLIQPSQGVVMLDGQPITGPQRRMGLVFQKANLMPWRSVLSNIALPLELAGVARPEREQRAAAMLDKLGLQGFESAYPAALSGGMAQRVAIGRALVYDPDVLLLDEPFGALDAMTREQMQLELLALWSSAHKTAIMVTHSITEAVFLSDRVVVMSPRPGRIRAEVAIELPRPRRLEMIHAPDFGAYAQRIRDNIELS